MDKLSLFHLKGSNTTHAMWLLLKKKPTSVKINIQNVDIMLGI